MAPSLARWLSFTALALVVVLSSLAFAFNGTIVKGSFKAFYCAGQTVSRGQDPYRVEPLRTCEHTLSPSMTPGMVEPAPLPQYALAPFRLLAAFPPRAAATVFAVGSAAATIASAWLLAQLLGLNAAALLAALLPLGLLNGAFGETPPFALLALTGAAYAARMPMRSGFIAPLALVQPNVGFATALTTFVLRKASRWGIVAAGATLGAIAVLTGGLPLAREYFTSVLPLQSHAEIAVRDQYSITHVLYLLGAPKGAAQRIGLMFFCLWTIALVLLARRVFLRTKDAAAILLLPATLTLLVSLYAHDLQMMLALPGAFFIASRSRGPMRVLSVAACVLLAVVWTQHGRIWIAIDTVAALGALAALAPAGLQLNLRVAIPAAVLVAVVACSTPRHVADAPGVVASENEFAATAWERYVTQTETGDEPLLRKLPTWIALGAIAIGAAIL